MKYFGSLLSMLLAIVVFYNMFFKLAPYICTLIPPGPWQGLIKVAAYFAVAYFGGVGLPLILTGIGIYLLLHTSHK